MKGLKAKLIVLLVLIITSVGLFFFDEIFSFFSTDKEREKILEKARNAKKEKSLIKEIENEEVKENE